MSEVLKQLNGYLTEMAAPTEMSVGRAIQLMDWLLDPKFASKVGNRKNSPTDLTIDEILVLLVKGLKENLGPLNKELKKLTNPKDIVAAVLGIVEKDKAIKNLKFRNIGDAQQGILNVWNSLQSQASRMKYKGLDDKAATAGIKDKTDDSEKKTNKDIEKELNDYNEILDKYRKDPKYAETIKDFLTPKPEDYKLHGKSANLNSEIMDSSKMSQFVPDLDDSKVPGIKETWQNIKEIISIMWAENKAYYTAELEDKQDVIKNASYMLNNIKAIKPIADKLLDGFGIPRVDLTKPSKQTSIKKIIKK